MHIELDLLPEVHVHKADFIDDLLSTTDNPSRLVRQTSDMGRRRFDLAVLIPRTHLRLLHSLVARVPFRLGYATQGRQLFTNEPGATARMRRATRHEVFYYLYLSRRSSKHFLGTNSVGITNPNHPCLSIRSQQSAASSPLCAVLVVAEKQSRSSNLPRFIKRRAKPLAADDTPALRSIID